MLIDKNHRGWIVFFFVALILASGFYAFYNHYSYTNRIGLLGFEYGNGPSGRSPEGYVYGIVGFGMMIFCGMLGIRRKVRIWRLGRGQSWLRAHIWLGLLAFPLILFHAGLKFGNQLTLWLMILFTIVTITGIIGVILQQIVPRALLARVQAESTFEQIPEVINTLRGEADTMVSDVCGPLGVADAIVNDADRQMVVSGSLKKDGAVQGKSPRAKGKASSGPVEGSEPLKNFYVNEVRPFLRPELLTSSKLVAIRSAVATFEHARTLLPDTLHDTLKDLESVCEERRQLATQEKLHFWLHFWEFIHIPFSYALLVLSVVHAVIATIRY